MRALKLESKVCFVYIKCTRIWKERLQSGSREGNLSCWSPLLHAYTPKCSRMFSQDAVSTAPHIICAVFSPCFTNAVALIIINNPDSLFSHIAQHFKEEEQYLKD